VGNYEGPLDELKWHWGSAYLISFSGPDNWIAQRKDNRATLRADNPVELLDLIRADYAAHPVSRRIAGADRPETPRSLLKSQGRSLACLAGVPASGMI
jgi:hypothetical protein